MCDFLNKSRVNLYENIGDDMVSQREGIDDGANCDNLIVDQFGEPIPHLSFCHVADCRSDF